jgi:hypothetical protein
VGINRTAFRSWQLIPQPTPISIAIRTSETSFHVFGKFGTKVWYQSLVPKFGTKVSERPDASKFRTDISLFCNRSRQSIPPKVWSLFARLCGISAQKFKLHWHNFENSEMNRANDEFHTPSWCICITHSCTDLNPFYWTVKYNRAGPSGRAI